MIVLGILLAHLLQSLDWLGIGHLFLATVATWIQELTLCQDTSIVSTTSETSGLCPGSSKSCSAGNPLEPPRVTLINAAAYSCTSKLEGLIVFQLQISLSEVTGHFMTTFRKVESWSPSEVVMKWPVTSESEIWSGNNPSLQACLCKNMQLH